MFRAGRKSSIVVLAAIMAVAGGTLDLCACDATSHGFLCPETTARHCGQAAPETEPSCCSSGAEGEEAPPSAPEGPQVRAPRCDCPVIDLHVSPGETPDVTSVRASTPVQVATTAFDAYLAPVPRAPDELAMPPWWDAGPPSVYSSSLPRHLELHVLRC